MTLEIEGKIYKSKVQYFKEMGECQRDGETYANYHRRCNMKYFPNIRKKVIGQCNDYINKRYHEDDEFRRKWLEYSHLKYLRKVALI
jgi:hypothetical protein